MTVTTRDILTDQKRHVSGDAILSSSPTIPMIAFDDKTKRTGGDDDDDEQNAKDEIEPGEESEEAKIGEPTEDDIDVL